MLFAGDGADPLAGYDDLLRSTTVDAFVVTDTYLGNPQAAWLERAAGAVRGLRPALGRPRRRAPVGRRRRRRPAPSWPPPTSSRPGHERIAWIGWRKDSFIGEDRRSGWSRAMRAHGLPTTRPGLAGRGPGVLRAARPAPCCSTRPRPTAFVCASDTLAMGVLHTLYLRKLAPGRDVAVDRLRRLPGRPGRAPRPELGAPAARGGRGRGGRARSRACSATRRTSGPGVLIAPTLELRGSSGADYL